MRPATPYQKPILKAALFDGSTTYLDTTQGFGAANSAEGILSCWGKRQIGDKTIFCEAVSAAGALVIRIGIHELFHYAYADIRLGELRLFFRSAKNSVMPDNKWHHFLFSWDTNRPATQKRAYLYIDDKPAIDEKIDASPAFIPETSSKNWRIGTSVPATSLKMKMSITGLYIETGRSIDASRTGIRRQWISPYLKPVRLDKNNKPQALFYFDGKEAGENKGSGPKFTQVGTCTINASNL
jgi:hypothetical protein